MNHMDLCQGKALFEALKSYNTNTMKGSNEIYKLLCDKKTGTIGGIYEDIKKIRTNLSRRNCDFQERPKSIKKL